MSAPTKVESQAAVIETMDAACRIHGLMTYSELARSLSKGIRADAATPITFATCSDPVDADGVPLSAREAHAHYQPQIDQGIRENNALRSYAGQRAEYTKALVRMIQRAEAAMANMPDAMDAAGDHVNGDLAADVLVQFRAALAHPLAKDCEFQMDSEKRRAEISPGPRDPAVPSYEQGGSATSITLRGEDAKAFIRHLDDPPNPAAIESLQRGIELLQQIEQHGAARVSDESPANSSSPHK